MLVRANLEKKSSLECNGSLISRSQGQKSKKRKINALCSFSFENTIPGFTFHSEVD